MPVMTIKVMELIIENLDRSDNLVHLVENIGVEPMTSCVQGRRSSQLS